MGLFDRKKPIAKPAMKAETNLPRPVKTEEEEPKHAIRAASRRSLTTEEFYVRQVVLLDAQGTFAARAVLVPWHEIEGKAPKPRSEQTEVEAVLFYGEEILFSRTLSVLNLLLLQGKRIRLLRSRDIDTGESGKLPGYFVTEIETLFGDEFQRTLKADFGPPPEKSE